MLKVLLLVTLLCAGLGGGAAARFFLFPAATDAPGDADPGAQAETHGDGVAAAVPHDCPPPGLSQSVDAAPPQRLDAADLADRAYVKLNNQFIVPVVTETRVAAMVVLSLSIEAEASLTSVIYDREPKLRTLFLQALFDQATMGRFSGAFATASNLDPLREELTIIARRVIGPGVSDVLVTDINRQDL